MSSLEGSEDLRHFGGLRLVTESSLGGGGLETVLSGAYLIGPNSDGPNTGRP